VLLGDGGIATELQRVGLPIGGTAEGWSLTHPGSVRAVHAAYAEAGAGWCTTNTFCAASSARCGDLCRAAVAAARDGAPRLPVLASLGPIPFQPGVAALYEEAVAALAGAGVDGFLVETITDLNSAELAIRAARASGCGPVLASFTPGRDGRLMDGTEPEWAAAVLVRAGADVVGVNCGFGPGEMLDPVRRLARAAEGPVLAAPNAGMPTMESGQARYGLRPDQFASAAIQLVEAGARLIAGCCGTTPAHIRAASLALARHPGD
jgi:5-methyltetrahydrofolate--homocysteine methyltransferase